MRGVRNEPDIDIDAVVTAATRWAEAPTPSLSQSLAEAAGLIEDLVAIVQRLQDASGIWGVKELESTIRAMRKRDARIRSMIRDGHPHEGYGTRAVQDILTELYKDA